jgi:hypothetical protein
MQMLQQSGAGGQTPSPLALAVGAAITKLAASPKQQLSPGGALGLDTSPLAAFGMGNSPPGGGEGKQHQHQLMGTALEQSKVGENQFLVASQGNIINRALRRERFGTFAGKDFGRSQ